MRRQHGRMVMHMDGDPAIIFVSLEQILTHRYILTYTRHPAVALRYHPAAPPPVGRRPSGAPLFSGAVARRAGNAMAAPQAGPSLVIATRLRGGPQA